MFGTKTKKWNEKELREMVERWSEAEIRQAVVAVFHAIFSEKEDRGFIPYFSSNEIHRILCRFEEKMREMMAGEIKLAVQKHVAGEIFIEEIIDRINRKQLKGKGS